MRIPSESAGAQLPPTAPRTSSSILKDGKLKPGIYRVQNLVGKTFVEMKEEARRLCCRSAAGLSSGDGLWDFQPFGPGYTIRKVDPTGSQKPDLYCTVLEGLWSRNSVSISPYPAAWRIQIVDDEKYKDFEYIRMVWSTTEMVWDLAWRGSSVDGTRVQLFAGNGTKLCQNWKLIPVEDVNADAIIGTAT